MLAVIGGGLKTWLDGTGLAIAMTLAGLAAIIAGLRGHWHRAMEIVGATLLGLFILGVAANTGPVASTLATLF